MGLISLPGRILPEQNNLPAVGISNGEIMVAVVSMSSPAKAAIVSEPELTLVVPVYRNRETVELLHARLRSTLESAGITFEMLFVHDGCPAGSLPVLCRLTERDPRVAVLVLAGNVGQQRAVMAGLAFARGKAVVVMDADLQDPPEVIPALLAELRNGTAAVFAGRRGRYESPARLATSRIFKFLVHKLSGVPADAGIFVAMTREMVARLLAFDDPAPFLVAMVGCTRLKTVSIPVERSARPSGNSAYSGWKRLKVGCHALARIPVWKFRARWPDTKTRDNTPRPVAFVGARFAHEIPETGDKE